MKKTYIHPAILSTTVGTETLIAASNPEGFNGTLGSEGVDGSAALAKERGTTGSYSVWDEDWSR